MPFLSPCALAVGLRLRLDGRDTTEGQSLAAVQLQGGTMEQYALDNKRRIATFREHMRSIFVKTGTDRQSDLARLLVTVPAVRD